MRKKSGPAKEPADAYRPFDARANGYVPGEGGAILLVEELAYAQKRGVPQIYGEIAGYLRALRPLSATQPNCEAGKNGEPRQFPPMLVYAPSLLWFKLTDNPCR